MVEKCKIGKMNCNRHLRVAYETVCIMRKIIKYTVNFFLKYFYSKKKGNLGQIYNTDTMYIVYYRYIVDK